MFGKRVTLFKLLGFEVRLDQSWIFLAILLVWTLGGGYFPYRYSGLPPLIYWLMGVAGASGLFFSIIFHELSHSLVARGYGMSMKGITLFLFGGVAEMEDEPPSPKVEFLVSVAGPICSITIGMAFFLLAVLGSKVGWTIALNGVLEYLAAINFVLALFNLIPAFPLDGGRMLRSVLWKSWNDIRRATRVASRIGSGFAYLLFALAIYSILIGNLIGGIWWLLIGMFLRMAAQGSYRQLLLRRALEGETIARFMKPDPFTVTPSLTIREFVEEYLYRYHFDMFPVVGDEKLLGCISTRDIREVEKEEWDRITVGDRMSLLCAQNALQRDTDAVDALAIMKRTGNTRLMVTDGEKLVGILSLKDLLDFLSLKVELEGDK